VFWRVDGFDFEQQELTLKRLAIAFSGDPACTDCNRVLRIPGFFNRKYSPAHCVAVEYGSDVVWSPADFHMDSQVDAFALPLRGSARSSSYKDTHSEHDWAWVCSQLATGKDAGKLTHELASCRSDKANPLYYAQRTVDVASARQWLLDGTPIDDIITMLSERRRFELPTAQRMVARRKTA
jgi:hypothetical protein